MSKTSLLEWIEMAEQANPGEDAEYYFAYIMAATNPGEIKPSHLKGALDWYFNKARRMLQTKPVASVRLGLFTLGAYECDGVLWFNVKEIVAAIKAYGHDGNRFAEVFFPYVNKRPESVADYYEIHCDEFHRFIKQELVTSLLHEYAAKELDVFKKMIVNINQI